MSCRFCAIIAGEADAYRVFEDEVSLAFLDTRPLFPGHCLLLPKRHYEVLTDFQTWVCSFAMLLGRLELFTLLVVMTPAFWRK